MKIVKIILGIVVLLVLLFFAVGLIKPSVSYQNEVLIDKPASESWSVMTDPDLLGEWLDGYIRSELISGEANTVGAVSNIYFDQNGKEMVIKETITKVIPNQMIGMDFENAFMNMDYEIQMQDVDGKTQINSKTTAKGNSLISRSMTGLMKGALFGQEDTNLGKLKELIESQSQ